MPERDFYNESEIGKDFNCLCDEMIPFLLLRWPSDWAPRSVILVLVCRLLPVHDGETVSDHIEGETKVENKS